jgi:hypothetical protein
VKNLWQKHFSFTSTRLLLSTAVQPLHLSNSITNNSSLFLSYSDLFLYTSCTCRKLLLHLVTLNDACGRVRTTLDKGSACRKNLYLTPHNSHKRETSTPRRDSNPQSQQASGSRPMLDRAATRIGNEQLKGTKPKKVTWRNSPPPPSLYQSVRQHLFQFKSQTSTNRSHFVFGFVICW